jgi:predicted NBD/HSP70 family sugar kinase
MNQRAVLDRLFRNGSATRAALAVATGMSRPTSGLIIDELLTARVLEEGPLITDGRRGRPGRTVMLERTIPRFLLVQVGVKYTDLAAVAVGARAGDEWHGRFKTPASEKPFLAELTSAANRLDPRRRSLWAFAMSLPGLLDETRGKILLSPNLHWTEKADLATAIPAVLQIPGCFVQEERAMALGHIAATDARDFLLVDVEDGVGAAMAMDGQLLHGSLPSAGEIGHTAVFGNRRKCGCGGRGCLETLIARPALLEGFASASRRPDVGWSDVIEALSSRSEAPSWLSWRLEATAMVIGGALNTSGLGRVLLVGALAELPQPIIEQLMKKICEASLRGRLGEVTVECAPRRRTLGLLQAVFSRLLMPTTDWSQPCAVEPEPPLARAASGRG